MNQTRELIRLYETATNENPTTLKEHLECEKEWINLHKEMVRENKKTSKKKKSELTPFIKKTMEKAKHHTQIIFNRMVPKPLVPLSSLLKDYERVYFAAGSKGIIEVYLKNHKIETTFLELLEKTERDNFLNNITNQEWGKRVSEASAYTYESVQEAFEVERELCDLAVIYNIKRKKHGKSFIQKYTPAYSELCLMIDKIETFLLKQLNYRVTLNQLVPTKGYKKYIRENGLLATIQKLEENEEPGFVSPTVAELLEHIHINHPLTEFPGAKNMKRKFIIHAGPTNSGKTYQAIEALKQADSGIYLAPIRLLALEIQEKLCRQNVPCDLITGEGQELVPNSKHRSSTIEMAPFDHRVDVAVIDEMQMIEDPKRGYAWVRAIFGIQAREIHLCGSEHALSFVTNLIEECGDEFEIRRYERQTSLIVEKDEFVYPHSIQHGDALIVFSKAKVLEVSKELQSLGYKVSMIYGKLPADTRRKQVELFSKGETEVLVSTDAIGIGLNLPIKRTVFLETEKYDGKESRKLTTQEVKQISGRAGRKGRYDVGFVNAVSDKSYIEAELLRTEKPIEKSVISPSPVLTTLPIGTLRQRLRAWQEASLDIPYLEKADIDEQLKLLKQIEGWEQEIPTEVLFKALYIPFDSKDRELLLLWTDYVRQLKEGKSRLTKPKFQGNSLNRLENYYQQINLYYNFSRKFKLKMDMDWIKDQKQKTTYHINTTIRASNRRVG